MWRWFINLAWIQFIGLAWLWFIDLAWVRFITRRPAPELSDPEEKGAPNAEPVDWQNEKKGISNSRTSFTADQPQLGVTQQLDNPHVISERGQS